MNKKDKLKKVVKRINGYNIRLSTTSRYAVYAGKKCLKDRIGLVEAEEYCLNKSKK